MSNELIDAVHVQQGVPASLDLFLAETGILIALVHEHNKDEALKPALDALNDIMVVHQDALKTALLTSTPIEWPDRVFAAVHMSTVSHFDDRAPPSGPPADLNVEAYVPGKPIPVEEAHTS
jgi:hypothetical protein